MTTDRERKQDSDARPGIATNHGGFGVRRLLALRVLQRTFAGDGDFAGDNGICGCCASIGAVGDTGARWEELRRALTQSLEVSA